MQEQDTICAVSTPPGEGGIGIIRISGQDAINIAARVFKPRHDNDFARATTHTLHYGHVVDPGTGETVDEVLMSVMRGPATYTREDVVEINCHGGMMPLWRTMGLLINAGARQAEPGEFTKRAFLRGRIDLAQAEAVMDIIRAKTDLSHRAANELLMGGLSTEVSNLRERLVSLLASVEAGIDFPEEDIETEFGTPLADEVSDICITIEGLLSSFAFGRILRDGFATAIVGRPNVGKSSLLNALLKQNRAIVTEIPGTTRDVLEEYLNVSGIPIRILDTAGIRHTHDTVEQEGVRRSLAAIESADIVLVLLDGSEKLQDEDQRVLKEVEGKNVIAAINKSDLPRKLEVLDRPRMQVSLSCHTGDGLDSLKSAVSDMVKQGTVRAREHAWAVNQRHKGALEQTKISLKKSLESINAGLSPEFIAVDLRDSLDSLGLIIGATYTEDILERIFNEFCIGK
ncbi:MAG TPA: tRNA uridine-5-carboxymethylaminomethyl(34) synthesis GTPase MnmE [Nitrospirota bacterium]|nr:tRNA uridine-5-carboxymethylaminomethyl(34) synthesis GTPase MnmE [Nitrospirota bacterium]